MDNVKKILNYFTLFQWGEILSVIGFTVYFALTDRTTSSYYNMISSLAAICGIICVVLCAAGKKSQYYWGLGNIIFYVIVSWNSQLYGEVMLNALYYFPTQFLGIHLWNKNYDQKQEEVLGRRMSPVANILLLVVTFVGIIAYQMLLVKLGGDLTWLDSTSTVISVVANVLMILRYCEQWLLWIIVDMVTVIMWGISKDAIMTTMWAVYLVNAVYGYINWSRISKSNPNIR